MSGQSQWRNRPIATPSKGMRRQLAEQCSIVDREATQVPEAMLMSHL
jgi:hypothetical protein